MPPLFLFSLTLSQRRLVDTLTNAQAIADTLMDHEFCTNKATMPPELGFDWNLGKDSRIITGTGTISGLAPS